jgi:hypothetical protein
MMKHWIQSLGDGWRRRSRSVVIGIVEFWMKSRIIRWLLWESVDLIGAPNRILSAGIEFLNSLREGTKSQLRSSFSPENKR